MTHLVGRSPGKINMLEVKRLKIVLSPSTMHEFWMDDKYDDIINFNKRECRRKLRLRGREEGSLSKTKFIYSVIIFHLFSVFTFHLFVRLCSRLLHHLKDLATASTPRTPFHFVHKPEHKQF